MNYTASLFWPQFVSQLIMDLSTLGGADGSKLFKLVPGIILLPSQLPAFQ